MAVSSSEDYDLQQAWREVLEAFAKQAKIDLKADRVLSPEEVVSQLKSKRDREDADSQKFAVVKSVVGKTLTCIQTLGGIAAQGASMAFPASGLCFNAISYLITAGQNYNNIFSNLTELFKQVSDVLERMVIYLKMKEIDLPLRKIIFEILQNIVGICGKAIKVLNGNKILKFLKVFALAEDDGVQGEMKKLKAVVEREAQMKTTLTYQITKEGFADTGQAISGVQAAVDKMADDAKKREMESAEGKQVEKIRTVLGISKEAEKQSQLHSRLRSEAVDGTGKWLQEETSYKVWSDRSKSWDKILFLAADQGYGKTFLFSSVVRNLQRTYARLPESVSRTSVAYYFLQPKDSKAAHSDQDNTFSVGKAAKTLALQLVSDPVYRKELATMCEDWVEPETNEELIGRLLDPCYRSDEVFYLIIDGIDQADENRLAGFAEILNHLGQKYTPEQRSHVRFFLSGRVEVVQQFATSLSCPSLIIDVAAKNGDDVDLFIKDRLSSLKLLQGETEQMKTLREEVFTSLSESAHGDFVNVDLLLKEIGTKQWPAEIREVLATAKSGFQRADTIAREVARCNESLSSKEIRDLNILLLWVMSAKRTLQIKELNAALFLENKESSLRPLNEQIRDKYSAFFHIDEEENLEGANGWWVSLSSDSIADHFKSRQVPALSAADGTIQEAEVKIIRRFLTSVCDQDLYLKFGFEDFFTQKLNASSALIDVDLEGASTALLLACLGAIASPATELEALRDYAITWWPTHMADTDLSLVTPADKMSIGKLLMALFKNEEVMPRWWIKPSIPAMFSWFFTDENIDVVLAWLRDTAVTKTWPEDTKIWVKSLTSNTSPDADLLEYVAKFLARMLVTDSIWDATAMYSSLRAFRTKIKHRKDATVPRIQAQLTKDSGVKAEDIAELFTWAATLSKVDLDSDYEANRCKGRAIRLFGCLDEAIKQYEHTLTLNKDGDTWYCEWGLYQSYAEKEEWQKAVDGLTNLVPRIVSGEAKQANPQQWLQHIRAQIAWYQRQLKNYEQALTLYDQILVETPYDYSVVHAKIQTFNVQEKYHSTIELLDQLQTETDPTAGNISKVGRLVHSQWQQDGFDELLQVAGQKSNQRSRYVAAYTRAVEDTSVPAYLSAFPGVKALYRVWISYAMSEEMWKLALTSEARAEVVELWEKLISDTVDVGLPWLKPYMAKRLVNVYADRLREHKPESPEAIEIVKKIADLSTEDSTEQTAWDSSINTNFLLARWYRSVGHDAEAMTLVKGTMKVGFDLLSDEDVKNDWQGWYRIATALMYYGDFESSLAAWSLVGPQAVEEAAQAPAEAADPAKTNSVASEQVNGHAEATKAEVSADIDTDSDTESRDDELVNGTEGEANQEQADVEAEAQTGLSLSCDGECGTEWVAADNIWMCTQCIDVAFCENCSPLLKSGELPINICNPQHELLHVPKWDKEEAAERGLEKVRLNGEKVVAADWVKELRTVWGL